MTRESRRTSATGGSAHEPAPKGAIGGGGGLPFSLENQLAGTATGEHPLATRVAQGSPRTLSTPSRFIKCWLQSPPASMPTAIAGPPSVAGTPAPQACSSCPRCNHVRTQPAHYGVRRLVLPTRRATTRARPQEGMASPNYARIAM